MTWNEWEIVWRRQKPPVGAAADIVAIKESFEAGRRKLALAIVLRNAAEGGTGIIVTGVFAWLSWRRGVAGWPLAISAALVFSVSCVFIIDLIRNQRSSVGPGAPLLTKIGAEIAEIRHQRRLLRTWWAWYIIPLLVAIAIAVPALGPPNQSKAFSAVLIEVLTIPMTLAFVTGLVAVPTIFLYLVWLDVRKTVKNIQLRIDELEKLRRYLVSGGEGT